uniref:RING-type E3 ubiquitin transferase n=1 Tax=Cyprinus carpio TaxID=7962 RepID=A0A8C1YN55_CYPCA
MGKKRKLDICNFVDTPDDDLICVICRAVLCCPVRLKCNHCCFRQVKCPCCRQPINHNQMLFCFLIEATFPLSNEYLHISSCLYEKDSQAHDQSCSYWPQLCPLGCGTLFVRDNQAQHNCYLELQQHYVAEWRRQRAITANLHRKMQRMQSRMAQIRRQIYLMCESLEVGDLEIEGEGTSAWTDVNAASPSSSRHITLTAAVQESDIYSVNSLQNSKRAFKLVLYVCAFY